MNKTLTSFSTPSDSESTANHDPAHSHDASLEAIFALNMGDFVTEHLISDDLLNKIGTAMTGNPEGLRKQLKELVDIYSLSNTLSLLGFNSNEGFVLYDSMATSLAEMLQVDACHLFLTIFQNSPQNNQAHFLSLSGTSVPHVSQSRWNIGYDLTDTSLLVVEAYEEGYPMQVSALSPDFPGWTPLKELNQSETKALIAVPLTEGDTTLGMIIFESYTETDFPPETVDLAEATARVFVVSLNLQKLLDQAQTVISDEEANALQMRSLRAQLTDLIADLGRSQQFFVESLSYAIDARNDYTQGHSQGVAEVAKRLAETMELNEKTVDLVYYAGLLASLGKVHVPQELLNKEEALTAEEHETLKSSPNVGAGLLMKMNFLAEVIPYIDYQKERWDGENSPNGLSGKSIPLGARIIGLADAYTALTQPRPYRERPLSPKEALDILQSEAGTKWDPEVVDSLIKMEAASAL